MDLISVLMDVGNTLYFVGILPQLWRTYQNRKNLKDLSLVASIVYFLAGLCFVVVGFLLNAYVSLGICIVTVIYHLLTVVWIVRSKKK